MKFKNELEDIHTHIEARLIDLIGLAGKNYTRQDLETIK